MGKGKCCKMKKKEAREAGYSRSWTGAAWARMVLEEDKRSETEREAQ